jgi:hypothetical protein
LPPVDSYLSHSCQKNNPTGVGGVYFIAVSQAMSSFLVGFCYKNYFAEYKLKSDFHEGSNRDQKALQALLSM